MSKEDKCHYTNMLNRLKMLDEQICQMQTTLKTVKDIMRKNFEERNIDNSAGEKTPDSLREEAIEAMSDESKGEMK
mgnify:CR=1 FL=1|jgi:4-hydroxy-3-methylbut-2-enyl diphosphate reductase IspH